MLHLTLHNPKDKKITALIVNKFKDILVSHHTLNFKSKYLLV